MIHLPQSASQNDDSGGRGDSKTEGPYAPLPFLRRRCTACLPLLPGLRFSVSVLSEAATTSFFAIQYESLLAQVRSTEVATRSSYVKAKAALQRAMGSILDENHISAEAAIRGR